MPRERVKLPECHFASLLRAISSRFRSPSPGQSHLIFGVGFAGRVITSRFLKLCFINALYKMLENGDAIALPSDLSSYKFS
jgi:hypothetical protein